MGNVVDSEMEDDTVTLPDGQDLPASPENRRRAAEMWQLDNKGQPERVERELDDEDERVERAEIELAEQRLLRFLYNIPPVKVLSSYLVPMAARDCQCTSRITSRSETTQHGCPSNRA